MIMDSSVRNLGDKAKTLSARLPLTRSDWSQMMRFCYERWCPKPALPSLILQFVPVFSALGLFLPLIPLPLDGPFATFFEHASGRAAVPPRGPGEVGAGNQ